MDPRGRVLPTRAARPPAAASWANGLLAAFLLFVSVMLHELSHSFVALAHGLSVSGITLHVFGGVSHLEDEPPCPRAEVLIAVAGPITSFAIAAVLWAINTSGLVQPAWAQAVVAYLVVVNVAVGIFNLVPGFPLDGGRISRAVLWKWKGPWVTPPTSRPGLRLRAHGARCLTDLQWRRPQRLLVPPPSAYSCAAPRTRAIRRWPCEKPWPASRSGTS